MIKDEDICEGIRQCVAVSTRVLSVTENRKGYLPSDSVQHFHVLNASMAIARIDELNRRVEQLEQEVAFYRNLLAKNNVSTA